MNTFTIKDLENLSGIKAHTIRIWEQRYSFLKPKRTTTNIRFYSGEELRTILNVALLNKFGFKISHIDKMNATELNGNILSLGHVHAQQERVVNEMIQAMIELNMEEFESVLDIYISAKGVERAITQIIFTFLDRIGILWLTNHILPVQEHLVSNIIRQKLIAGIESINTTAKANKTVILFLPENEYHELGLLFIYYLMKSRGIKVYYLGANVPLKDLEYIVNLKHPDLVYTHLTAVGSNFNFDRFLNKSQLLWGSVPFVISGQPTTKFRKNLSDNIILKRSLSEVMEYIASI